MAIWFKDYNLSDINQRNAGTMAEFLEITATEIGEDYLVNTMPVTAKVKQPLGIVHGGASCVLAETVGSVAGNLCIDPALKVCVGLDINANHIRSVKSGLLTATAQAIHIGRKTHVWQITIKNDQGQTSCLSRLTLMVLPKN